MGSCIDAETPCASDSAPLLRETLLGLVDLLDLTDLAVLAGLFARVSIFNVVFLRRDGIDVNIISSYLSISTICGANEVTSPAPIVIIKSPGTSFEER